MNSLSEEMGGVGKWNSQWSQKVSEVATVQIRLENKPDREETLVICLNSWNCLAVKLNAFLTSHNAFSTQLSTV